MSRLVDADGNTMPRFPRVSGDEPYSLWNMATNNGFSPRERG